MRGLRGWVVAVGAALAALLSLPVTGMAQSSSHGTLLAFGNPSPFTAVQIPVSVTGSVVVRFRGDPATGCARRGLCGYAGTIVWTPPSSSSLEILETRSSGRRVDQLDLSFADLNGVSGNGQAVTDADVEQTPPAPGQSDQPALTCGDTSSNQPDVVLGVRRGRVRFSLVQANPSPFQTRCAGPLIGDLAPALVAPAPTLRAVTHGAIRLDLAGSHRFVADGFAGSVDSTLTLRLGRPHRLLSVSSPSTGHLEHYREVQLKYRATVAGRVITAIRGDTEPGLCAPLGACGLRGTLSITPSAQAAEATIQALGPASRPERDFLTALGLSAAGRAHGIAVSGELAFDHGGVITARSDQRSVGCRDSAALGGSLVEFGASRGRLFAQYTAGTGFGDPLRTRCPGPFDPQSPLAGGSAPLSILARPGLTLSLASRASFVDDGYSGESIAHLTLTLRRQRLRTLFFGLATNGGGG